MENSDQEKDAPGSAKKHFEELSPHAFEHPLDKTALLALQKVPGIDWVIKTLLSVIGEKRLRLFFLGSAVRVSERQFPKIHRAYLKACKILDIENPPELFVTQRLWVNAAAIGINKPFIIVTAPLVEMMDEKELQCVLGHELGHIMCGHALYTTILMFLINGWQAFVGIPGGALAVAAIRLGLLEWSRKAELTADRAGLLVSQNPQVSYRVDMKLAGGSQSDQMDLEEFFKQAEEYEQGGDLVDGILKIALLLDQTHPLPVLRVRELKKWVDIGEYDKMITGTYLRRGEEPEETFSASLKNAAASYKETFSSAKDPLVGMVKEIGEGAAQVGNELIDFLKRGTKPPSGKT